MQNADNTCSVPGCRRRHSEWRHRPDRVLCGGRRVAAAGFTLIELMVAVTVLVVLTLLLTRIISQSNTVISDGARQATQNANARMALDFLSREFAQSGGDGRLHFRRRTTPSSPGESSTYGASYACHDLWFVTFRNVLDLGSSQPQNREGVRVAYYVKKFTTATAPTYSYYSLMRAEKPIAAAELYTNIAYNSINENTESAELIRHVVEFRAVCHDTNATASVMNSSEQDHLPAYIDVYLAVLSEPDARRACALGDGTAAQRSYIDRAAKRYHTRCWSLNRTAYILGR